MDGVVDLILNVFSKFLDAAGVTKAQVQGLGMEVIIAVSFLKRAFAKKEWQVWISAGIMSVLFSMLLFWPQGGLGVLPWFQVIVASAATFGVTAGLLKGVGKLGYLANDVMRKFDRTPSKREVK